MTASFLSMNTPGRCVASVALALLVACSAGPAPTDKIVLSKRTFDRTAPVMIGKVVMPVVHVVYERSLFHWRHHSRKPAGMHLYLIVCDKCKTWWYDAD